MKSKPNIPTAPDWLEDAAVAKFQSTAEALIEAGISIGASDADTLAVYAQAAVDYVRLTKEIRTEGETVKGYRGSIVKNPKLTVQKSAYDRMKDAASRLGLSPKARIGTPRWKPF